MDSGGLTFEMSHRILIFILCTDDNYAAEDFPEETWSQLSKSESEYEPSQESSQDSDQVLDLSLIICTNNFLLVRVSQPQKKWTIF